MNKTYLKVGVAITAAFAFGFVVGQAILLRKVEQMFGEEKENLKAVRDELIFQAEKAEEPVEEKEEDEMAIRRRQKKMEITPVTEHEYEVPFEVVINGASGNFVSSTDNPIEGDKALKVINIAAAERIEMFTKDSTEDWDFPIMQAILHIQSNQSDMYVQDITPYAVNEERRKLRFVYIRNENKLYWMLGGWRNEMSEKEAYNVIARLMTFSVARPLSSGDILWTTYTPIMLLDDLNIHLPDDEVELAGTRIFWMPDINIEVEVVMFEKDDFPGRILAILDAHAEG